MIKHRAILLKIVGYAFLFIGIAGGLASIGIALNGEFFIWLICVVSFCGIGWISVLSSKDIEQKMSDATELSQESQQATTEKKSTTENKKFQCMVYIHKLRNFLYPLWIRTIAIKNIYLKFLLSIIAISLIILVILINDKLSAIENVLWRICRY